MAVLHPALRFEDLTVAYDRHPAVHHFSGVLPRGALAALVGPNGAGKSSVFKAVVGLAPKMEGRVDLCGLSPADIAYLPQQAELDRSFPITVADAAMLGHLRRVGFYGEIGPEPRARAAAALAAVGLAGFETRPIGTLSVGQLQRALFARILLQDAPLILLDEPFNALDGRTVADLLAVVRRWHGESRTVVAILHDLDQVRRIFPTTILLAREVVSWGPTETVLTAANLDRARLMAEAWDDNAAVCEKAA